MTKLKTNKICIRGSITKTRNQKNRTKIKILKIKRTNQYFLRIEKKMEKKHKGLLMTNHPVSTDMCHTRRKRTRRCLQQRCGIIGLATGRGYMHHPKGAANSN